jgi:hypothetical protein
LQSGDRSNVTALDVMIDQTIVPRTGSHEQVVGFDQQRVLQGVNFVVRIVIALDLRRQT